MKQKQRNNWKWKFESLEKLFLEEHDYMKNMTKTINYILDEWEYELNLDSILYPLFIVGGLLCGILISLAVIL